MRSPRTLDLETMPVSRPLERPVRAAPRLPEGMEMFARPTTPLLIVLTLAALVFFGITLARSAGLVAALWGASAFAVACWLRGGKGRAFDLAFGGLITVGVAAGELMAGNDAALTLMFTTAQLIEIVTALVLIRRFSSLDPFSTVEGASRFLLCAAVLAPIPAGLFATTYLTYVQGQAFAETFQTWWFGHALGFAILTPFAMSLTRQRLRTLRRPLRLLETIALQIGLGAATVTLFWQSQAPISFLLTPLLILAAVRLRLLGATFALAMVAIIAVGLTMHGHGPFTIDGGLTRSEQVMVCQLFVVLGCLPTLLVSSVLEERDRLAQAAEAGRRRAEAASGAKSRLLANVAHEIKSPIGGVIGIGDLWSSGQLGPVTPTQAEMATMLVKTARQVEALAHDLLDVARAEAGAVSVQLRPTDVVGIVQDLRRSWAVRPETGAIKLEVDAEHKTLVAQADSQRLAQVLDNLTSNAVKYGASGGEVRYVLTSTPDVVRIEVRDRGPGLSPEKQTQLFEPFNRLGLERSTIEGHGIGLALARRLVELQHGRIGVTSAPGQGATFWVELPAA
ncbi:ATP-binding protein [Brevundimonas balnearis]|uniref:ATP-binding protein n=1 Tax=Brevundimonas balnearis TaxID=1572858 RepID=UPI00406BCEAD